MILPTYKVWYVNYLLHILVVLSLPVSCSAKQDSTIASDPKEFYLSNTAELDYIADLVEGQPNLDKIIWVNNRAHPYYVSNIMPAFEIVIKSNSRLEPISTVIHLTDTQLEGVSSVTDFIFAIRDTSLVVTGKTLDEFLEIKNISRELVLTLLQFVEDNGLHSVGIGFSSNKNVQISTTPNIGLLRCETESDGTVKCSHVGYKKIYHLAKAWHIYDNRE